MTEHRTDWQLLTIELEDGSTVEALGWWCHRNARWVLDRIVNDKVYFATPDTVLERNDADVLVLPAPSGPVVKQTWGWLCGDTEAEDLEGADGWADELPQHIADSRAIAAHIRGLTAEQVWLDPEPLVPRPEPRVFRAGDPEPDGVRAVLDADSDVWQRRQGGWPWVLNDEVPMTWDELLHTYGPVVEVFLPTPVTA